MLQGESHRHFCPDVQNDNVQRNSEIPKLLNLSPVKIWELPVSGGSLGGFAEPADPTNYTFALIRFSLLGRLEARHSAQFICWPGGQLSVDKWPEASCEGGRPAFWWRTYSFWLFEEPRVFSFLAAFQIQSAFMKYAGAMLACKWQLKIKADINPDTAGLSVGEDSPLNGRWFVGLLRNRDSDKAKAQEFSWTAHLMPHLLVCSP